MRILLAEDDHHIATLAQMVLTRLGNHTVTLAQDGAEALEKAQAETFDLILLDSMMPKKNGLAVAQSLRVGGGLTPIIFFSAKSQQSDIDEFLSLGIGFIQKPFEPTQLCTLIDSALIGSTLAAKAGSAKGSQDAA